MLTHFWSPCWLYIVCRVSLILGCLHQALLLCLPKAHTVLHVGVKWRLRGFLLCPWVRAWQIYSIPWYVCERNKSICNYVLNEKHLAIRTESGSWLVITLCQKLATKLRIYFTYLSTYWNYSRKTRVPVENKTSSVQLLLRWSKQESRTCLIKSFKSEKLYCTIMEMKIMQISLFFF